MVDVDDALRVDVDDVWRQTLAGARVVELPLRVPFRGVTARQAVLIEGSHGWGEFAPFPEYRPQESSWWLDSAMEAAWVGWPKPIRQRVGINAIVPAVSPETAQELGQSAAAAGYQTIKVKVAGPGSSLTADLARVAAVRHVFPGRLRVDANAAWTVDEAVEAITVLRNSVGDLEYVEQPCRELAELAQVRRLTGVPVAADESIRRADDPLHAARAAAADVLVVKAAPLGGVRRALRVVAASGLPVVVSSALDTAVGLASGLALALAVPHLAGDCGLGTGDLFEVDVTSTPAVPMAGEFHWGGLPPIDPDALAAAQERVSEDTTNWWLDRMTAAWMAGSRDRVAQMLADSAT